MLTKNEAAARLNVHKHTLARWAEHGLITSQAHSRHDDLCELPKTDNTVPVTGSLRSSFYTNPANRHGHYGNRQS